MTDRSESPRFQDLFESALQYYEKQTGKPLASYTLAEQLQNCKSIESVTALLHAQALAFSKFRGSEKIIRSLKNIVSAVAALCQVISMVSPWLLIGCSTSLTPIR